MRQLVLPAAFFFAAMAAILIGSRDAMLEDANQTGAIAMSESEPAPDLQTGRHLIKRERDGHYWAMVTINGATTRMMVDTGATQVVLTRRDAARAGLEVADLPRNASIKTAGGAIEARTADLKSVSVEGVEVRHVRAVVLDETLPHSLLGMSYLNRLSGWRVSDKAIVLEP